MIDTSIPTSQPAIEQLEDQPNLLMGLIGGGIAMLAGAIAWGAITYFTQVSGSVLRRELLTFFVLRVPNHFGK